MAINRRVRPRASSKHDQQHAQNQAQPRSRSKLQPGTPSVKGDHARCSIGKVRCQQPCRRFPSSPAGSQQGNCSGEQHESIADFQSHPQRQRIRPQQHAGPGKADQHRSDHHQRKDQVAHPRVHQNRPSQAGPTASTKCCLHHHLIKRRRKLRRQAVFRQIERPAAPPIPRPRSSGSCRAKVRSASREAPSKISRVHSAAEGRTIPSLSAEFHIDQRDALML